MAYLIRYQKISDAHTEYTLDAPDGATELCRIDGYTYVSIPDSVDLPEQPAQISGSIELIELTPELRAQIMIRSPHVELINHRIAEKIRDRYTIDDELYYARIAGGVSLGMYEAQPGELEELAEYKDYVESIRAWGRQQRALLGL